MVDGTLDVDRLTQALLNTQWVQWAEISPDAVRQRIRSLSRPSFADISQATYLTYSEQQGKSRWGDKTPRYMLQIPLLSELFPIAKFVHIIRDGRNVALSLRSLQEEWPWVPRSMAGLAAFWRDRLNEGRSKGRLRDSARYLEVRYENLVENPEEVLRTVCQFIELEFRPEMLRYFDRVDEAQPERTRHRHLTCTAPSTEGTQEMAQPGSRSIPIPGLECRPE